MAMGRSGAWAGDLRVRGEALCKVGAERPVQPANAAPGRAPLAGWRPVRRPGLRAGKNIGQKAARPG